MLYMPVTSAATPVVLADKNVSVPLQSSSGYYLLQSSAVVPAVPVFNTTYVYPRYGFIPAPVESSITKEEVEKPQTTQTVEVNNPAVQHVVHHHIDSCCRTTCPGYCEICCPWIKTSTTNEESIDEKIARIRRELEENPSGTQVIHHIHYPLERPRTPPASYATSNTTAERRPWSTTNRNDYPWRDAHLPAYRQATLSRSQTNLDESNIQRRETAHERSHRNTQGKAFSQNGTEYIYRPKSEVEARKWYQQTTGKDPEREVYQALHSRTNQTETSAPTVYRNHVAVSTEYPVGTRGEQLRKIETTQHHDVYSASNSLHVLPKHSSSLDGPQVKILNAPVTYIY